MCPTVQMGVNVSNVYSLSLFGLAKFQGLEQFRRGRSVTGEGTRGLFTPSHPHPWQPTTVLLMFYWMLLMFGEDDFLLSLFVQASPAEGQW